MRGAFTVMVLLLAFSAWGAESRFTAQLEPGHDRVVQRVVVPSVEQPQGEVQVVRRDELVVVQTLLASRVLKRVAGAIAAKETKSWPPGSAGHVGSLRYRDELYQAVGKAWQSFRQRTDREDLRQFLAIEFILGPRHNLVALSLPNYDGTVGSLIVKDKQLLAVWSAPRDYVRLNSAAIVADNFNLDTQAAAELLARVARQE